MELFAPVKLSNAITSLYLQIGFVVTICYSIWARLRYVRCEYVTNSGAAITTWFLAVKIYFMLQVLRNYVICILWPELQFSKMLP